MNEFYQYFYEEVIERIDSDMSFTKDLITRIAEEIGCERQDVVDVLNCDTIDDDLIYRIHQTTSQLLTEFKSFSDVVRRLPTEQLNHILRSKEKFFCEGKEQIPELNVYECWEQLKEEYKSRHDFLDETTQSILVESLSNYDQGRPESYLINKIQKLVFDSEYTNHREVWLGVFKKLPIIDLREVKNNVLVMGFCIKLASSINNDKRMEHVSSIDLYKMIDSLLDKSMRESYKVKSKQLLNG